MTDTRDMTSLAGVAPSESGDSPRDADIADQGE
jgi:hypothetical protein